MSKTIKYILGGILILLLAGYAILVYTLNGLVKSGIESRGSELAQTGVSVDKVSINPWSGSGIIEDLRVRNPEGFESEYAIAIQNFEISLDISSIFSDSVIINEIFLTEPAILGIQKIPQNNLSMLMKNMETALDESEKASSQGMIIRRLVVREGQVTVTPSIEEQPTGTVVMDDIELRDVGGATAKKVVRQVASRVINEALKTSGYAVVLMDSSYHESSTADAIRDTYGRAIKTLPNYEALFDLRFVDFNSVQELEAVKKNMNLFIASPIDDKTNVGEFVRALVEDSVEERVRQGDSFALTLNDRWHRNQWAIILTSTSDSVLAEKIKNNEKSIVNSLMEKEFERGTHEVNE